MDYETKPVSIKKLRNFATIIRLLFKVSLTGAFPVLESLEKLYDVIDKTNYEVLEDDELPANIPARCFPDEEGHFTIQIKESVYSGAQKGIGACRGFIMHEICHVFLYKMGFTPIHNRTLKNNSIPPYRSMEWQAKALCGEVMMPYEETIGLTENEIISKYKVSKGFAQKRLTY